MTSAIPAPASLPGPVILAGRPDPAQLAAVVVTLHLMSTRRLLAGSGDAAAGRHRTVRRAGVARPTGIDFTSPRSWRTGR